MFCAKNISHGVWFENQSVWVFEIEWKKKFTFRELQTIPLVQSSGQTQERTNVKFGKIRKRKKEFFKTLFKQKKLFLQFSNTIDFLELFLELL